MSTKNFTTTGKPILNARGLPCGYVRGETFYRKFDPNRHILKYPVPALAYDRCAIDQAFCEDVERLEAFDGQGTFYRVTLSHFLEAARLDDRGYGPQYVLPLTGWSVTRKSKEAMQLPLFGGAR